MSQKNKPLLEILDEYLVEKKLELSEICKLLDLNSCKCLNSLGASQILNLKNRLNLIQMCGFTKDTQWQLVYRASLHGFSARNFHDRCDNVKSTLTIVETNKG